MIDIEIKEANYFLPEDGDIARAKFLELINMPSNTYISGYGFTMPEVFKAIEKQQEIGISHYLLLDYSQASGLAAKPMLHALYPKIKHGSLVLTTAGIGSDKKSAIWHFKAMVKEALDGGEPWCWDASVNMSASGWFQGNTARVFRSQAWADEFRKHHAIHTKWALENQPHYQASMLEAGSDLIDAYFDQINVETELEETANHLLEIAKLINYTDNPDILAEMHGAMDEYRLVRNVMTSEDRQVKLSLLGAAALYMLAKERIDAASDAAKGNHG